MVLDKEMLAENIEKASELGEEERRWNSMLRQFFLLLQETRG